MEESRGPLPSGWASCALADVADLVRGIAFPSSVKSFRAGKELVACLRTTNVQQRVEWDDLWWVPEGFVKRLDQLVIQNDILISVANSYELVGKVALVRELVVPATIGAFIALIRAYKPMDARCLYYFLASPAAQSGLRAVASTTVNISNVNTSKVRALQLPLAPVEEQSRIADALDELLSDLDAGVLALERVRAKLAQYRASVLKAAVDGTLTADWRAEHPNAEPATKLLERILAERQRRWEEEHLRKFKDKALEPQQNWKATYKEPATPTTAMLPQLPEGWCWAALDQLSLLVTSGSRGWREYYAEEGAVFIRSQDIRSDHLLLSDVAHVLPPKSAEGTRTQVRHGDLLVTITGANVAKAAVVDIELAEAYVSQHVALIRPVDLDFVNFLHIYVTAPSGGRKLLLESAYGAGKPGLNLDNLRELAVPIPPRSELEVLVDLVEDQLSVVDHLEADLDAKLKSAQALRQAILRHAFTGQLVPQDPNDEPGSELLKRIAADRESRARDAAVGKQRRETAGAQRSRVKRQV